MQGLRTLVLGTKILPEEVWADWDSRYQDAAAQLDNRDEALAALAVEIEADLEMVGVTAIEDKLQEGVPAAIQSLLNAGMKVQTQPQHVQRRNGHCPSCWLLSWKFDAHWLVSVKLLILSGGDNAAYACLLKIALAWPSLCFPVVLTILSKCHDS